MLYLDHSATMIPDADIISCYSEMLTKYPANPASIHSLGHAAMKAQAAAALELADLFDCRHEEIIFTSGGTESINLAIKGALSANSRLGRRVLVSAAEHSAVFACAAFLEKQGYEVERIPLSDKGSIDLDAFETMMRKPCALVSLIHVNNETGAVTPVAEAVRIKQRLQPQTMIHLDAVQSTGKIDWSFRRLGVDFLSGSGHKFGTPRGIGWLIHKYGFNLDSQLHGGGQQRGLRPGTENPPLVITMAEAAKRAFADIEKKNEYIVTLKDVLLDALKQRGVSFDLISPAGAVPQIVNLAIKGLRGETLLHALESKEIFVSTGSACSSKRYGQSEVLKAMKLNDKQISESVRISLSSREKPEQMVELAEAIREIVLWLVKK